MNRGLSDVSLEGLTGFSKLKRGGRGGGGGRPTETSERPRFTGLRGLLFLFCAPAPIRPRSRALSSLSVNARLVIVSAHARISSLLVLVPVPRRGFSPPRESREDQARPRSQSPRLRDGFADRARSDIGRRRRSLELSSRETRRCPIRIPSRRLRRPRPCLAELESRKEESGNRRLTGSAVTILRAYLASFCRRVIYARGGSSVEICRPFRIPGIPAADGRCPSPNRAILPLSIVGARCVRRTRYEFRGHPILAVDFCRAPRSSGKLGAVSSFLFFPLPSSSSSSSSPPPALITIVPAVDFRKSITMAIAGDDKLRDSSRPLSCSDFLRG